jgi:hypothetical protein
VTRAAALLVVVALLTACSQARSGSGDGRPQRPGTSTSTPSTTAPPPRLPPAVRYAPVPGEPEVDTKQLAADVVQTLTTYAVGEGTPAVIRRRLAAMPAAPEVADAAAPLLKPGAASLGEIVYPQLGGLAGSQASVMVVVRQRFLEGGTESAMTRTIDVRLDRSSGTWRVIQLASLGGEPPAAPPPMSAAAAAVLDNDRIQLPDSARWDIQAGLVDARVLDIMLRLAQEHSLGITTLAAGHPYTVFGSGSVSNHTVGRAVDVWALNGVPVVAQRDPAGPLYALVSRLLAEGVTELGSPWDLHNPAGASFTDTVHQDHLHLGYDA